MTTHLRDAAGPAKTARNVLIDAMRQLAQEDVADDDMVRRTFDVEIRAGSINKDERSAEFILSSEAIDSYDEIVEQDWDLKRYKKNPVVLYGHNRGSGFFDSLTQEETLPIGHAEDIRVEETKGGKRLVARLHFATAEATPMAERVWQGILQKSLRAVSVGFRPGDVRAEKHSGKDVYVLSKNVLFENSVVPIGANWQAVSLSADGKPIDMRARQLAQLQRLAAKQAGITPPAAESRPETTPMETNMDPKELTAEIEALKAANVELQAKADAIAEQLKDVSEAHQEAAENVDELTEKLAEVTAERDESAKSLADVTEARDALQVRVDAVEAENRKTLVESYIGKKATPAERDVLLEDLERLGSDEFQKRMALRSDLPFDSNVAGPDPKTTNDVAAGKSASARVAEKAARG
jgi:hypothetical protein